MSAITAKASRKMKKYAVLTREPRCFLGSFDFSWEQRKVSDLAEKTYGGGTPTTSNEAYWNGDIPWIQSSDVVDGKLLGVEPRKWITQDGLNNSAAQLIPGNSIAIITRVGVGKLAFMPYSYATSQDFLSLSKLNAEPLFTVYACYKKLQSELNAVQGTSIKGITKDELLAKNIMVPRYAEQQQIGAFFKQLDNLITLHQRKCANLCSPSQVVFSLLFATSTFSWEQRKLGDVVKEIIRNDPESEAPIMMITANNGFIEQSERYAFNNAGESLKKYILLKKGELAYNHGASKLRPYGSCFALTTAENARIPFVYHCFSAENQNAEFMSIELNGAEIENQLRKIVSSGARMDGLLNISFDEYTSVSVLLPGTEEQDCIADFFRHLDNLITLHQRECISFTGRADRLILTANKKRTTSSWEQRKVGDLLIERNQQAPMSDEYPLMAFIANEGVAPKGERYDRSALVTDTVNKLYKKTEKGDFIYSSNNLETGSIGLNKYGKACISPVYSIFEPTGIADSDFLGRRLVRKDFINAMVKWRQGVIYGQWRIHESDFLKIEITVPSVEEQRKIGTYLDQLDHLITLHQRKPFLMKWRTSDANRNQTNRLVL